MVIFYYLQYIYLNKDFKLNKTCGFDRTRKLVVKEDKCQIYPKMKTPLILTGRIPTLKIIKSWWKAMAPASVESRPIKGSESASTSYLF